MPPSAWNQAARRIVSAQRSCGLSRIQLAVSSPYRSSSETRAEVVPGGIMDEKSFRAVLFAWSPVRDRPPWKPIGSASGNSAPVLVIAAIERNPDVFPTHRRLAWIAQLRPERFVTSTRSRPSGDTRGSM